MDGKLLSITKEKECHKTVFVINRRGYGSLFDLCERHDMFRLSLCPCKLKMLEEHGYTQDKILEMFNEKPTYDEYGCEVYQCEEEIVKMLELLPESVRDRFYADVE